MAKFYVPEIGDQIILSEDWKFNLYPETRNEELGKYFGYYLFQLFSFYYFAHKLVTNF